MRLFKLRIPLLLIFFVSYQIFAQEIQTIELRPGPENGYDGEIRTDMDYPIWYEDDFIANAWTVQGWPFVERSLVKFDLSEIPEGSVIISAKLSLFCNTISGHHQLHAGNNACYLLTITQPWDQYQVVWNSQPATTMQDVVIIPQSTSQTQDYPDINVTDQIDYFYNNPSQNYGFMLQLIEEYQYAAMVFSSSNHVDPAKRPLLTIEYTQCEAPDPSFTYSYTEDENEIQFSVQENNNTTYWWDFGNGFYSDLPNPLYTYPEAGVYNVCLEAMNGCDTLTFCDLVEVCSPIDAGFSFELSGNFAAFTPDFIFDDADYFWDFGDGFLSYLQNPLHYYNEVGNYLVCLKITNECNQVQFCDSVNFLPTVIMKHSSDNMVHIFPNPTAGSINVVQGNLPSEFKKIRVINSNGMEILNSEDSRINQGLNSYFCDLSGMQSGIYTVQVTTDRGVIHRKVVVSGN